MLAALLLGFLQVSNAGTCNGRIDLSNGKGGVLPIGTTRTVVCPPRPISLRDVAIGDSTNPAACTKVGNAIKLQSSTFPLDIDTNPLSGIDVNTTIKVGANGCGSQRACIAVLNKTDGCKYAMATKRQWIVPMNKMKREQFCNLSANATGLGPSLSNIVYKRVWKVKTGLGCCTNGDNCNEGKLDHSQCTENTEFSEFVQNVYDKWDYFKYKVIRYTLCNEKIRNYTTQCRQNRQFKESLGCRRRVICKMGLRKILTEFGERVCQNATRPKYGAYIARLLEDELGDICPGLDLSCNDNRTLVARNRIRRLRIKLKMLYRATQVKGDKKAELIALVAKKLNVAEDDVVLDENTVQEQATSSQSVSNGRRRLSEVTTTAEFIVDSDDTSTVLGNSLDCSTATFTDSNVQGCGTCSTLDESTISTTDGSLTVDESCNINVDGKDAGNMMQYVFALVISLMAVLIV